MKKRNFLRFLFHFYRMSSWISHAKKWETKKKVKWISQASMHAIRMMKWRRKWEQIELNISIRRTSKKLFIFMFFYNNNESTKAMTNEDDDDVVEKRIKLSRLSLLSLSLEYKAQGGIFFHRRKRNEWASKMSRARRKWKEIL